MKKILIIVIIILNASFVMYAQSTTAYKVPRWVQNKDSDEPTVYSYDLGGGMHTVEDSTAKADISFEKRVIGMLVSWQDDNDVWYTQRFEGLNTDDTAWVNVANWKSIGGITSNTSDLPDSNSVLMANADSTWWQNVTIDSSGSFYWYNLYITNANILAGDSIPIAFATDSGRIVPMTSNLSLRYEHVTAAFTSGGDCYIKTHGQSADINRYTIESEVFTTGTSFFLTPHTNASAYFKDNYSNDMDYTTTAGEVDWWIDLADFDTGGGWAYLAFPFTINKIEP